MPYIVDKQIKFFEGRKGNKKWTTFQEYINVLAICFSILTLFEYQTLVFIMANPNPFSHLY